ncbi:MAG: hypothetical protein LBV75_02925 [Paludibacter sp.]|nr:hypothetical protein [Paludibacter sp.]
MLTFSRYFYQYLTPRQVHDKSGDLGARQGIPSLIGLPLGLPRMTGETCCTASYLVNSKILQILIQTNHTTKKQTLTGILNPVRVRTNLSANSE